MMRYILPILVILLYANAGAQEFEAIEEELFIVDDGIEFVDNSEPPKLKIEKINDTYSFYFNENLAEYNRSYGLLKNGKMLFPQIFERRQYSDTTDKSKLILSVNTNFGLFDLKTGRWSIPLNYRYLIRLKNEYYLAKNARNKYGIIDSKENIIEDFSWSYFTSIDKGESYIVIMETISEIRKYGVYGIEERKLIVPCIYDQILGMVKSGFFIVKKHEKYNLVDANNVPKFKHWYDLLYAPSEQDVYVVKENGMMGIIDGNENTILPCEYFKLEEYPLTNGSLLAQNKDSLYGCVNYNGEISLPFIYTKAANNGGFLMVEQANMLKGVVGIIEEEPREIIPCEYNNIIKKRNLFIVEKKGKYGMFDFKGNQLAAVDFDAIDNPQKTKGLHIAKKAGKYFFVDNTGKRTNKKYYKQVKLLSDYKAGGYYRIVPYYKVKSKRNRAGLVDIYGKEVIPESFDDIITGRDNYIVVEKNNKVGLYHILRKKLVLPVKYDKIVLNDNGFYSISGNDFYKIKIDDTVTAVKL